MEMRLEGEIAGAPISLTMTPGVHSVGRSPESALSLADPSVSRAHAELHATAEQVIVRDVGSRNGTFVNGRRLDPDERVVLTPRDSLRFGAVTLRVHSDLDPLTDEGTFFRSLDDALATGEDVRPSARLSWEQIRSEPASSVQAQSLLGVLIEAGGLLVAPRPLDETFALALGLAARIVPARRVLLLLLDEAGAATDASDLVGTDGEMKLPVVRAAHPPGSATESKLLLSRTLLRTVLEDRTALLVDDAQTDARFVAHESIMALELHSAMVAPLFDNERVIGLIYADTNDIRQRFDAEQLRAFSVLANLLAVKITNARLYLVEQEGERMRHEIERAARIQQSLLPRNLPTVERWSLHAVQRPCYECAGDLYEVALTPSGLFLAVGDVSGKGMGAALLMSHVMACLRLMLEEEDLPLDRLVTKLHRQVMRASRPSDYLTLFAARQVEDGAMDYVNAGHNPPLLVRRDGRVEELGPTGFPVGLIDGSSFEMGRILLAPGDLLAIYTDGVTETIAGEVAQAAANAAAKAARAASQTTDEGEAEGEAEEYGTHRLGLELFKGWRRGDDLETLSESILTDVDRFRGAAPPEDDITLLLVSLTEPASAAN